ncbi:CAF17-like 4Fe-4S cluster assembly/insertion protein YgfZ [Noviherbaspirillum aerium]|uniref:CAF17-like 4Fe-4S cluster assembly/insertion protein YgfZ n=1 Tax=Noviherbaspirillum aerium TaxID=2588497 RepID=UPI00124E1647|nr:folate-binding protein YgfZ [Noviherbaspirillum aerium]
MNTWLQFLAANGARIDEHDSSIQFDRTSALAELPRIYVAPLTDQGLILLNGDDAASFLHNQITNDVEHLPPTEARLAGYCSPKGRLLASFLMWKSGQDIFLQLSRQIQAPVQKRLQMFVLRAKAKLADAADQQALLGIGGTGCGELLASWFPVLPAQPFAKIDSDNGSLIRLPDAFGNPRYQWIMPVASASALWPDIAVKSTPVGTDVWRLADIHAGIPQITQPTQEQFVPQMINFELIGGVNFKKGCYPGQEIVARSQYLGKLKRRMLLASVAAEVKAGMEVYSSADPDQPCGMVVNAAPNLHGASDMLVEIKIAAAEEGSVHLGSAQGPALSFSSLPYALPA